MKALWTHERPRKPALYGLYRRKSMFHKQLVCFFFDPIEAKATARELGRGFEVRRMHEDAFKCPLEC